MLGLTIDNKDIHGMTAMLQVSKLLASIFGKVFVPSLVGVGLPATLTAAMTVAGICFIEKESAATNSALLAALEAISVSHRSFL